MNETAQQVHVNLSERSYDIHLGSGILHQTGSFISAIGEFSRVIIITDENVVQPYASVISESLSEAGLQTHLISIAPGETSKSIERAANLWQQFLDLGADRKTLAVAVGGGVIGDLAGFAAATYARGIRFYQIPTTLLAQVDSSVGGKVGINLPQAKNMVGSFWQPLGVLIDIGALDTLPDREYRAGLAEVVKYGVILDADFFCYLENNIDALNNREHKALQHVVARCCRLKADVVEADEREESGMRVKLNYGHTFCHAIEAVSGYGELLHGEAVSIGMLCASRLAETLGYISEEITQRQHQLLTALKLPVKLPDLDCDKLVEAMQHDKKTEHGNLRFVLPMSLGHVEVIENVDPTLARAALV